MSYLITKHVLVFLFFMFMHVELKNIRIIELELFERTRCAIRRRLRRDELRYDRSKRVANRVGAEGDGHGATRRRARARARHRPSPPNPSRPRSNAMRRDRSRGRAITRRRACEQGLARAADRDREPRRHQTRRTEEAWHGGSSENHRGAGLLRKTLTLTLIPKP